MTPNYEDALREAMAATVPPKNGRQPQWDSPGGGKARINHARVVAMKEQGKTNREIADTVFCEIETVQQILRQHRLRRGEVSA